MRMILATACCQIVQHLFLQEAIAKLRYRLLRKLFMPLYQLEQELIHILLMAIYPTKSYPNSVHLEIMLHLAV
ncbi:hypothetical protein BCT76_01875 [Vibrio tasmaniensis]|nr:hypothetical protein BCT76_01875 [Vibrio tasmaniensis]